MQVKEYVKRYCDRLLDPETSVQAADEIVEALIRETNAEWATVNPKDEKNAERLKWKYNNKGNVIAETMEQKAGRPVLKKDWFRHSTKDVNQDEDEERRLDREEIESWE